MCAVSGSLWRPECPRHAHEASLSPTDLSSTRGRTGNIRKFSGLIYSNETHKKEVLDKKKQWMTGQTLKVLKSIGVAFGVQTVS